MKKLSALLFFLLAAQLTFASSDEWSVKEVHKSIWVDPERPSIRARELTIEFENGVRLETNIFEFQLLDVIESEEGIPFILFSGGAVEIVTRTHLSIYTPLKKMSTPNMIPTSAIHIPVKSGITWMEHSYLTHGCFTVVAFQSVHHSFYGS